VAKKPVPAEKAAPAKKPAKGAKAAKKASPAAPAAPAKKAAAPAAPAKKAKVAAQAPVKKPAAKPAPAAAANPAKDKAKTKTKAKAKAKIKGNTRPKGTAKSTAQWLAEGELGQLIYDSRGLVIRYGADPSRDCALASHFADGNAELVLVIRYATVGTLGVDAPSTDLVDALVDFLKTRALVGIAGDSTCCPPVVNSAKRSTKKKR
jgi:hypothetical protein